MTTPVQVRTCVGVDGWKDGWVAATVEHGRVVWRAFPQPGKGMPGEERTAFRAVLAAFPGATLAVDIPIGTRNGPRRSDVAAREFLGSHGAPGSSIFTTPSTSTLLAHAGGRTHAQAMTEARASGLPGTSIQSWHLIPKMIEVAAALAAVASTAYEAHPECSFRAMDPRVGGASKKSGLGVARRLRALREGAAYDVDLLDLDGREGDVPTDDLLDAAAVLWTAHRIRDGSAIRLPVGAAPGEPVIRA